MQEMQVPSLGNEGPLEEGMATHSSIPAWKIPWTEEPGGLQSMGPKAWGCKELDMTEGQTPSLLHAHNHRLLLSNENKQTIDIHNNLDQPPGN